MADPGSDDWVVGAERPNYSNFADIDVGSRRWRIVTDEPVAASTGPALATGVSGTALTLLIAGLLASISVSRRRALSLADSMTEDLRESEERLRAANESMRAFVDIAAHDLRSPLVSIGGFSSILREGGDSLTENERVNALRTIERQSQHMNRLIDDMLTMSSIDGGGLQPKPETLTVAGAIADCLNATRATRRSSRSPARPGSSSWPTRTTCGGSSTTTCRTP